MKKYIWVLLMASMACSSSAQSPIADSSKNTLSTVIVADDGNKDSIKVSQPHIPEYILNVSPELLKDRLSCIQQEIPLEYNKIVHGFVDYFIKRNRYFTQRMLYKKDIYFPVMEKYLAKHNLPSEIKYLAIIESGLNPRAKSVVSASGLWQFMYLTGRTYGLSKDWYTDDRFDPEKSTQAACKYIASLYAMFKDWNMALAAYNCGPNRVRRAIRLSGNKKSFWEIYKFLPRETRSYVPQFIAINYAIRYSEEHYLTELPCQEIISHDTINVKGFLHLPTLADLTGGCIDELRLLNPSILHDAIPGNNHNYVVNIPLGSKLELEKDRISILDSASRVRRKEIEGLAKKGNNVAGRTLVMYKVRRGDVLGIISRRFHVRVSDIRRWNKLRSNLIRVGQKLKIWVPNGRKNYNLKASKS